jgi:RNA polymerase sigma-70 factor (ECF subfamily)
MASFFQGVINNAAIFAPATATTKAAEYSEIYSEHSHRIYSLAFWMTDNELAAEELAANTFLRAFSSVSAPTFEQIDYAFLTEVRELAAIGSLTLSSVTSSDLPSIRGNVKRVHLERAVVQLPATEKLIFLLHDVESYEHERIAKLLGITTDESKFGLHQARLRVRELVARMQ